jgi:hypothetical protein
MVPGSLSRFDKRSNAGEILWDPPLFITSWMVGFLMEDITF